MTSALRGSRLAPPAAVLVVLLLAAAGGVRGGSGGNAAAGSRKLVAGGSGNNAALAELVKDNPHASAEGKALVVKDSAPSSASRDAAEAEAQIPPLQLIIAEEGRAEGAVCLDGSAPGFYYRKGYGSGRNNWVLYFEGGAWCASPESCVRRAASRLGSTDLRPSAAEMEAARSDNKNGSMNGMLSPNRTVNPDFYNWNAVYLIYCDGGSFSGDVDEPVHFNGTTLYMRGRRIADVLLKRLLNKMGLDQADTVLVSGCSAGAVALLVHCDGIKDTLKALSPSVGVRCLADSSMFLNVADVNNTKKVESFFIEVKDMHNLTDSLPAACIAEREPERHHECFMPRQLLQFVSTPLFLINSNYDKVALMAIGAPQVLDTGYRHPPNCFNNLEECTPAEKEVVENYRKKLATAVAPLLQTGAQSAASLSSPSAPLSTPANAVFLFSCVQHGSIHSDMTWTLRTANGVPMNEAVSRWMHPENTDKIHLIEGGYPCNSCPMKM